MHHPTDRITNASHGALAETRNSSQGPPWGIDQTIHHIMSRRSTMELHLAPHETEMQVKQEATHNKKLKNSCTNTIKSF